MFEALKTLFASKPATPLKSLKDVPAELALEEALAMEVPRAAAPIFVTGEVDDNSLLVLGLITEAADLVGVDLFNSNLFQYYQSAVHGEDLPEGGDEDELELMREWTHGTTLPERFCVQLVDFFDRVDEGIKEKIQSLSQYRFERLRTWSNCHVTTH